MEFKSPLYPLLICLTFSLFFLGESNVVAQTNVGGVINTNTTWTKAASPFTLIGDVGVNAGITLTIEPGVIIKFVTGYKLQIQGNLIANGNPNDSVYFDGTGTASGAATLVLFRKTNLSNSTINYCQFISLSTTSNPYGIQLAQESEFVNDNPKNSGVLNIKNSSFMNTWLRSNGYSTTATIVVDSCLFKNAQVWGTYPRSESIYIKNSKLFNSNVTSDSYNYGIWFYTTYIDGTTFHLGCCGANFKFSNVQAVNSSIVGGSGSPQNGPINIDSSVFVNSFIDNQSAVYTIASSKFIADKISSNSYLFSVGTIQGVNSEFNSNGVCGAIKLTGFNGYNVFGSNSISKCLVNQLTDGIYVSNFSTLRIDSNNFKSIIGKHINNIASNGCSATKNYFELKNAQNLDSIILDGNDNLNYGVVNLTNTSQTLTDYTPVSGPVNVVKIKVGNAIKLTWRKSIESKVSRYIIYYNKKSGNYEFADTASTTDTTIVISTSNINDSMAITAIASNTSNSMLQKALGNESWFSFARTRPVISATGSTTFCLGGSVSLKTDSSALYKYQWKKNGLNKVSGTGYSVSADSTGYYYVVVTANGFDLSSDSILITVNALPNVGANASPSATICANSPITLIGTGASSYSWSDSVINGVAFLPNTNQLKLAPKIDFTTGVYPYGVAIGDMDGDNKPDLVVTNNSSNTISVFRNTGISGSISSATFAPKVDFNTGSIPNNVAIGDIDGDNKPDLVVTNMGINTISVFRNTGATGTINSSSLAPKVDFTTGSFPIGVTIGDIDGDNKPDLVVTNNSTIGSISVFRNTGTSGVINNATLAPKVDFTTGSAPNGITIGDIDGDNKADLVVTNQSSGSISVFRNTGTSGIINSSTLASKVDFTTGSSPNGVAIGDIDGDNKQDLVVTNQASNTISVFRNTGTSGIINSATLAPKVDFTTGSAPNVVAIADMDGDNKPDMVVTNRNSNTISVFRNTRATGIINSSTLAPKVDFTIGSGPIGLAIGDMNSDAKPDLIITNSNSNTISVFKNRSNSFDVTGTDVNGCTNTFTKNITINPLPKPVITVTGNTTICTGSSLLMTANTDTGLTYQWLKDNAIISGATSTSYNANVAGSYMVLEKNGNNCQDTSLPVVLVVQPVLANNSISSAQTICPGTLPSSLTGTLPTGGSGTYTYQWQTSPSGAGNWSNAVSTQSYSPPAPVSTLWYRRYVNSGSCYDTSSSLKITLKPNIVSVTQPNAINITYGGSNTLPDSLNVLFSDSSVIKLAVSWNTSAYTGNAGNYNFTGTLTLIANTCNTSNLKGSISFIVNKSLITVTASSKTKVYGAADPLFSYSITSGALVGTDLFTGALTRTAGENIGKYAINIGTLALSTNYILTYIRDSLTITPKAIAVKADPKAKIYGASNPALTYTITSGGPLIGSDAFTGSLIRTAGENIGKYPINQGSLALSTNYTLTYTTDSLTITVKAITVKADSKSKVYGVVDPGFTYTITLGALVGSDAFSGALARTPGENVGKYVISQGSLALSSNYALSYTNDSLTISAKPITITAAPKSKVYGDADPSFTYSITVGAPLIGSDVLSGSLTRTAGENKGKYVIAQGTLTGGANYSISYIRDSLTIAAKAITVKADAKSKVYGASDPGFTYSLTVGALVGSDVFSGALSRTTGENIGKYLINQGNLALSNNYTLSYTNDTLIITSKPITITAAAKSKIYGDADPSLTYTISSGGPLIGSDVLTGSLTRTTGENKGKYSITQGTLSGGSNYSITYIGDSLTILVKAITVKADSKSKVYGTVDPGLTFTLTAGSLVGSDAFSGSLTRAAGENAGKYLINQASLTLSSNYSLTFISDTLNIIQRPLTVKADAKSKLYNATDPLFTYTITSGSLAFNDSISGSLTRTPGQNAGKYDIKQGTLSLTNNYILGYIPDSLTITPIPFVIKADAKSKVYGFADPALTFQVISGNYIGTDTLSGAITRIAGESIGNYLITVGTLTITPNYAITFIKDTLKISARSIAIKADAKTKVYGELDPSFTYQIVSGSLVSGDSFSGALTRLTGNGIGKYPVFIGTLGISGNYALTYSGDSLTISKRPITLRADKKSKTYGTTDSVFHYVIQGGSLAYTDTLSGLLSRLGGEHVGTYSILQGTIGINNNYNLIYIQDTLTILTRSVTIRAASKVKYYGSTDPLLTYSITNGTLVFSDTFSGNLSRTAGEDIGRYEIAKGTLGLGSDYNLTYVPDSLTIKTQAILTGTTIFCEGFTRIINTHAGAGISYQWLKNNSVLTGEVDSNLVILVSGVYKLVAKNTNGFADTTSEFTFIVNPKPKVGFKENNFSQCVYENNFVFTDTSIIESGTITRKWLLGYGASDSSTNAIPVRKYSLPGLYQVKLYQTSNNNCTDSAVHTMYVNPKPKAGCTINNDTQCFIGNQFVITDTSSITSGSVKRIWDNGDGTNDTVKVNHKTFNNPLTHTITLYSVSDKFCLDTIQKTVFMPTNLTLQSICLVTIDSATNKNAIVWERSEKAKQHGYRIYKESTVFNVFDFIGFVPADSQGYYIDTASHPEVSSNRYKISSMDTCGNESTISAAHKTLHLNINAGANNSWNLIWENYEGNTVNTINIYRGTSPTNMLFLAAVSSSSSSYTDLNPPANGVYYMVSVDFGVSCDPSKFTKTSIASSRSNVVTNLTSGITPIFHPENILVYPNPTSSEVTIETPYEIIQQVVFYDAIGRMVYHVMPNAHKLKADLSSLEEGVYLAEIKTMKGTQYVRVTRRDGISAH